MRYVKYVNKSISKWIGKTVAIEGRNSNERECKVCGKNLKQSEYLEVTDLCKVCKRNMYDGGRHESKLPGGNNNIDEILMKKMEEEN